MTFTPAAHRRHVNKFFTAVKQRGSGAVTVIYPDVALEDHVSQVWLTEHQKALPPGTVIKLPSGATYTTGDKP